MTNNIMKMKKQVSIKEFVQTNKDVKKVKTPQKKKLFEIYKKKR